MSARSEIAIAGLLVVFCLVNYLYLIPTQVVAEGTSPVYPHLVNTMLLCFSLAYLAEGIRLLRQQRRDAGQTPGGEQSGVGLMARPVLMLLTTGAWVLTLERLGFLVSTALFLMVSSQIFGSKSWRKALALSVVMPLVIYFVFYGLNSMLPQGPLDEMLRLLLKKGI